MKKFLAAMVLLSSTTLTGCMSVYDGDKVFAISAKKILIGKGIDAAEDQIPAGATVLEVAHRRFLFGLIQGTYISGTK